jgi:hypothetical protein
MPGGRKQYHYHTLSGRARPDEIQPHDSFYMPRGSPGEHNTSGSDGSLFPVLRQGEQQEVALHSIS